MLKHVPLWAAQSQCPQRAKPAAMWEAGERPPRAVSVPVAEVLQQFGKGLAGVCDPGFEYVFSLRGVLHSQENSSENTDFQPTIAPCFLDDSHLTSVWCGCTINEPISKHYY